MRPLLLVIALTAAACGGRATPSGDGTIGPAGDSTPADPCRQAFYRIKACVDAMTCTAISDPTRKAICEAMKQVYVLSYDQALAQCEQQNPGQCSCTGEILTQARALIACPQDPATCLCVAGLDAGP
jgi:hypothetical protein